MSTIRDADAPGSAAVYSSEGLTPTPSPGQSGLHQHLGHETGATMAGGLVTFRDITFPWTVWYDEILMLHRLDGEFELEFGGRVHAMQPGDVAWAPAGTCVTYRARGEAVLFYAAAPSNWQDLRPG